MKKILITEDEPGLLEMYKLYFERAGYKVIDAADGKIGVSFVKKEKPDLILLDILMPQIDGWTVLKELKNDPETKTILIVIFSNLAQNEEIQRGLAMGADQYLVKSALTPKELLAKVQSLLDK
ncbi:MAG: response regulator [Candidatus Portnoybacteria bacterium]|nr:response regulator [Candidatus Portnoybacteria bacterium]